MIGVRLTAEEARMDGGCLCGAVRYAFDDGILDSGVCHCETCRRASSAAGLPFAGVRAASFRFVTGAPLEFSSSPGVVRSFCGRCGSPLTYRRVDRPDVLDVMTVSLDQPAAAPPTFHVWASEALDWDPVPAGPSTHPRDRAG